MPVEPISVAALICERVLNETDHVHSLVRVVDLFYVTPDPDIPPEKRPVQISLFFAARFAPEDDAQHKVEFHLQRPSGEQVKVAETEPVVLAAKFPDTPKTMSLGLRFGVFPKALGTHYVIIAIDGKESTRVPFTLRERIPETQIPQ